jgi:hypothetical protein
MNKNFAYILLLLSSCNSHQDTANKETVTNNSIKKIFQTIPEITLPLKIRCENIPDRRLTDSTIYYGKITKGDLTILLKNKINDKAPVMYSNNRAGQILDSLILFKQECYLGVDSQYDPWIEITKDLKVILTDTAYNQVSKTGKIKGKIVTVTLTYDTTITRESFNINSSGKFEKQ